MGCSNLRTNHKLVYFQVLTRFLGSASPAIYWFAAHVVYNNLNQPSNLAFSSDTAGPLSPSALLMLYKHNTIQAKCILLFFLGYFAIGTVAFSNFLPWTWCLIMLRTCKTQRCSYFNSVISGLVCVRMLQAILAELIFLGYFVVFAGVHMWANTIKNQVSFV